MNPKQGIWRCMIWGVMGIVLWSIAGACQTPTKNENPSSANDASESSTERLPPGEVNPEQPAFEAPWTALQAPKTCDTTSLDQPKHIPACPMGNGDFGFWHIDPAGLPAYVYTMAHLTDKRAVYPHSWDPERRDHFHQIGNDRVNGIAYNDGVVVLMSQERGVTFYNRYAPDKQQYAGGFSLIAEGDQVFNTAYRWRPEGAKTERIFGLGYAQNITQYKGLRITHTIFAPPGDVPMLIDQVTIQNLTQQTRQIRHYNYWDLNHHQASFQPIRTGTWGPRGDDARDKHNAKFQQELTWQDGVLEAAFQFIDPAQRLSRETISPLNHYPPTVWMTSLLDPPTEVYTDQAAFLGKGGIKAPSAAASGRKGEIMKPHEALDQPAALIMRHDLTLLPGASHQLRFGFGYLPQGKQRDTLLTPWKQPDTKPLQVLQEHWKSQVAYAVAPQVPLLSREVAWRAYKVLSATNYLDYYDTHVTPQGSAYLYLHGFDGAPRDQALFSLALTYLRPALARANIQLIMGLTQGSDGQISYSFHGHGVRENAIIHTAPSDLDIFFLLAVNEYLVATGDIDFLTETVSFHPKGSPPAPGAKSNSVLDHIRAAVTHLVDKVGLGEHGLLRVGTGDWSDSIVHENTDKADPDNSISKGESIPNSQMAIYTLQRLAATLSQVDASLSKQMQDFAEKLKAPTLQQFNGKWFTRAILRDQDDQPVILGDRELNLESQVWGLLAGLLTAPQQTSLANQIHTTLDAPSPIGPTLTPKGMVWPAIAQLVTWAYTRTNPAYAWTSLTHQMYATHAEKWPSLWFGIWSGADGFDSQTGLAWKSPVTPMTDWPVMNANQDAMFLLGLLRVAGIEPTDQGLQIQPLGEPKQLSIDFALIQITRKEQQLSGIYRPQNKGTLRLILKPPTGSQLISVQVNGNDLPLNQDKSAAQINLTLQQGTPIPFSYQWK